ncbi:hypothetical protein [Salininema proteolyticum]|uniref:Uncharacterized protein n=1 Tax=Salininema proteolyticum TaxID=1607685 RepID=A0ABV8TSA2_9ACTN
MPDVPNNSQPPAWPPAGGETVSKPTNPPKIKAKGVGRVDAESDESAPVPTTEDPYWGEPPESSADVRFSAPAPPSPANDLAPNYGDAPAEAAYNGPSDHLPAQEPARPAETAPSRQVEPWPAPPGAAPDPADDAGQLGRMDMHAQIPQQPQYDRAEPAAGASGAFPQGSAFEPVSEPGAAPQGSAFEPAVPQGPSAGSAFEPAPQAPPAGSAFEPAAPQAPAPQGSAFEPAPRAGSAFEPPAGSQPGNSAFGAPSDPQGGSRASLGQWTSASRSNAPETDSAPAPQAGRPEAPAPEGFGAPYSGDAAPQAGRQDFSESDRKSDENFFADLRPGNSGSRPAAPPQDGFESQPQGGFGSQPQGGYGSQPPGGFDSQPQGGAGSRPQTGRPPAPQPQTGEHDTGDRPGGDETLIIRLPQFLRKKKSDGSDKPAVPETHDKVRHVIYAIGGLIVLAMLGGILFMLG